MFYLVIIYKYFIVPKTLIFTFFYLIFYLYGKIYISSYISESFFRQ